MENVQVVLDSSDLLDKDTVEGPILGIIHLPHVWYWTWLALQFFN